MKHSRKKIMFGVLMTVMITVLCLGAMTACGNNGDKVDYVKQNKIDNYKFLNENYAKDEQVVIVGDSIIEIYNTELFNSYTERTYLTVYNRGISGDYSELLLSRIADNAVNIKPSYMVMLIGTNDIALGVKQEEIVGNISKAVSLTKEQSPATKIILLAVLPVNPNAENNAVGKRSNKAIRALNNALNEAVKASGGATMLDLTQKLSDENGNLKQAYTYDGLHPNARGYAVITKELLPFIGYSE